MQCHYQILGRKDGLTCVIAWGIIVPFLACSISPGRRENSFSMPASALGGCGGVDMVEWVMSMVEIARYSGHKGYKMKSRSRCSTILENSGAPNLESW